MDDRQKITAYHLYYEEKNSDRIERLIDMAEAVRMGNASIQSKQNSGVYFKWINRLKAIITPEKKTTKKNLWDVIRKKRKRSFVIN